MKITQQIMIVGCLSSLVPLFLIGGILSFTLEQDIKENTISDLKSFAKNKKSQVEGTLHLINEIVDSIASRTAMRQNLALYNAEQVPSYLIKIDKILSDVQYAIPDIVEISIVDPNGIIVTSTQKNIIGNSLFAENYFKTSIKGNHYNAYVPYSNYPTIFTAHPLIYEDEIIGVVTIYFLDELIGATHIDYGETGEFIIAKHNENEDALFLNNVKFDKGSAFTRIVEKDRLDVPITQALLQNHDIVFDYVDYRGISVIAVTDYIEHLDMGLVVKKDMSEALSLVTQLQTYSFMGFVIVGVLISAALYGSSILITRPILKLYNKTSQMKDLDVELKPEGPFEVRELINSFNEMIKKQKELDKQKDEFSSMISHELKTPLVAMKGHLQMLQENMLGELSEEQKETIDEIQEKSNELWKLIEDTLDVKNIILGDMSFEKEPIEIKKFIDKIINSTNIPKEKDVEIVSTIHYNIVISSDKTRLSQVFSHLIKNAIEYVPTKKGKIEISAIPKDDSVLFCIKDNGHGMPIDELKHVFKKYYQVDSSETRKHGGLGLGLVLCQGIVEGLGGNIWVESEGIGKGTSFFFTIPKN